MKNPFLIALSLLTIIPTTQYQTTLSEEDHREDSGRSALLNPLIGLIIGLVLCIPLILFSGASSSILAAIVIAIWAIVTGGIHLIGLAHCADVWLGGVSDGEPDREKAKQMLNSCFGTTGIGVVAVISLVCVLLLKFVALSAIIKDGSWLYILMAPVIGRAMILLLFQSTEFIRLNRAANVIIDNLPRNSAGVIIIICCLVSLLISPWGILFVLVGFWLIRHLMIQRLGGFADDTAGATVEISEMLWLLGIALFL